ncbi:hypothetical protein IGI04_026695 [Brassica rapa subsp. trilocularis]|nr:hypothetical protein IGI04_026695 [Brassica rapa subsp. trilocularis]
MELSLTIIPGLTDDVAVLCLSRIPRSNFRVLSQVCRRWKTFLRSEHFAAVRKLTGTVEEFMCVLMETVPGKKVYWEVFDSSGNKLGQIPNVPGPLKWGYGVTVLGGEKILFIGGYTGIGGCVTNRNTPLALADVYEFDPATNSWGKLPDMNIPRYNFALAEVDGLLYVVRGYTNDSYCLLNSDVYNPETNQWTLMDCPQFRNISGFAFSFKSKLYALGNGSCTVDIYDPKTKTWEELELEKSMSVYSYTVVRNKVYFLDKDLTGRLGVFDPEENSWTTVFVPTVAGGFRFGVGQWNNKVLLFSRLSVHETIINDFDKEKGSKWRYCSQIKPSGSHFFDAKEQLKFKMEESSTSIIPGLTDDVAALCLSRIPRSNFRVLSQVCRRWKTFLRSEHFAAVRKLTGTMEEFMCVFMKSIRGRKVYWEVFDSSGNNLGQIPPFPGPLKRGFCVAVIGGEKILFIGGYTGMKYWDFSRIPPIASGDINEFSLSTKRNPPLASADVYEFNPATNSWRKLADMNIPRYDFSLAEVDGLLYVVQGFSNDGYCLYNTEVYNPQTNQWSLMDGPVAFPIGGFAFSFKSKLYAFLPTVEGGYRSGLGQWNNKVLLFSRLSVRETLINGFDKEEGFKWRDCDQIKPSGSYLIHVLINF